MSTPKELAEVVSVKLAQLAGFAIIAEFVKRNGASNPAGAAIALAELIPVALERLTVALHETVDMMNAKYGDAPSTQAAVELTRIMGDRAVAIGRKVVADKYPGSKGAAPAPVAANDAAPAPAPRPAPVLPDGAPPAELAAILIAFARTEGGHKP